MSGRAYSWQLPDPSAVQVNIDYAQMGVGGDNSWGKLPFPIPITRKSLSLSVSREPYSIIESLFVVKTAQLYLLMPNTLDALTVLVYKNLRTFLFLL